MNILNNNLQGMDKFSTQTNNNNVTRFKSVHKSDANVKGGFGNSPSTMIGTQLVNRPFSTYAKQGMNTRNITGTSPAIKGIVQNLVQNEQNNIRYLTKEQVSQISQSPPFQNSTGVLAINQSIPSKGILYNQIPQNSNGIRYVNEMGTPLQGKYTNPINPSIIAQNNKLTLGLTTP